MLIGATGSNTHDIFKGIFLLGLFLLLLSLYVNVFLYGKADMQAARGDVFVRNGALDVLVSVLRKEWKNYQGSGKGWVDITYETSPKDWHRRWAATILVWVEDENGASSPRKSGIKYSDDGKIPKFKGGSSGSRQRNLSPAPSRGSKQSKNASSSSITNSRQRLLGAQDRI